MVQNIVKLLCLTTPPRRNGRDEQFLTKQVTTQIGEERKKRRTFHQTGAERIGHRDGSCASRLYQARNSEERIAAQFEGIAERVVHAAENHIHWLEAFDGF